MAKDGWRSYQQIAVLGIAVITRGWRPLKKPRYPCRALMMEAASKSPRADRILRSFAVPLVWSNVLITSRGVVRPAANPPARPPATQWVIASYVLGGFITFDIDSYAMN